MRMGGTNSHKVLLPGGILMIELPSGMTAAPFLGIMSKLVSTRQWPSLVAKAFVRLFRMSAEAESPQATFCESAFQEAGTLGGPHLDCQKRS